MTLVATPGGTNSDSYATLEEADEYFLARGLTTWGGTNDVKESALRRATAYLDNAYRGKWIGIATTQTQALAWPRVDGYRTLYESLTYPLIDPEGFPIEDMTVPRQIKTAAIESALLSLSGTTLEPNLARGGQIKSIGKSVGPLRKDIVYADGASVLDRYIVIEGLLRGLVTGTPGAIGGSAQLVRA
jgi:hypothetical protein